MTAATAAKDESTRAMHHKADLWKAVLAVQSELHELQLNKDRTNPAFRSKYLSLDALMDEVLPLLSKHGLVWLTYPNHMLVNQGPEQKRVEPNLAYRLVHAETGQETAGTMPLLLVKRDPQGLGSAITYARRYSLMAVLGLVADEDDDGNKAGEKPKAKLAAAPTEPMMTTVAVKQLQKEVKDGKLNWETLLGAHGIEPGGRLSVANGAKILKALRQAIPVDPKRPLTDEEREKVLTAVGAANLLEEVETRVGAPAEEWTTHDAKRIREILDERKKAA